MSNTPTRVNRPQLRLHFIPEWAAAQNMSQAELGRRLGADKGSVSRWFDGVLPQDRWLVEIAELFQTDVHSLFIHPANAWVVGLLRDNPGHREKIEQMLELMFGITKPKA